MQKWIEEKKIKFIVQYNLQPSPELPGVPMVMDLAKTDAQRTAMRLLFARTEYARPYFLPPGVPAERVAALRRAFDATMKDSAFVADAEKLHKLELSPMTGEVLQELVAELSRTPPEIVKRVRNALDAPTKWDDHEPKIAAGLDRACVRLMRQRIRAESRMAVETGAHDRAVRRRRRGRRHRATVLRSSEPSFWPAVRGGEPLRRRRAHRCAGGGTR